LVACALRGRAERANHDESQDGHDGERHGASRNRGCTLGRRHGTRVWQPRNANRRGLATVHATRSAARHVCAYE
jgi:hypothetical protein